MKALIILKFSLASLILVTLAIFGTIFMKDSARNEAAHIVIYIFAALAILVAIINVCGGYLQLRADREKGLIAPWYKKYRLTYGMVLLINFLFLLFLIVSSSIDSLSNPVNAIILLIIVISSSIFEWLTNKNKS